MPGPLHGITVLDLTQVILGPWATQMLGDMGADVIKVEPPSGDVTRRIGPARNEGMAAFFLGVNRNKRSIAIDLKDARGRSLLLRLAGKADVFVHAMRPRAIHRLGLSYDAVAARRPDIVYMACHGFRSAGRDADRPAYDDLIQSLSGIVSLQARSSGAPRYVPSIVCDKTVSLMVVANLTMALLHRFRTGQGQRVETPMFESMAAFTMVEHLHGAVFDPPLEPPGYARLLTSERRPYPTRDGVISVLPYNDAHWERFTSLPGFEALGRDPRFRTIELRNRHVEDLYGGIGAILRDLPTRDLEEAFTRADIPFAKVNDLDDLLADPDLEGAGLWQTRDHETEGRLRFFGVPAEFSATPGSIRRMPPRLGEHTREVLAQFAIPADEIDALVDAGVATQAPAAPSPDVMGAADPGRRTVAQGCGR